MWSFHRIVLHIIWFVGFQFFPMKENQCCKF
uniref:Uncharacterized protein n=1 Tax=Rhizophora mucronata TaxID=61149 RepID=A0A2P2QIB6_RHIMU